MMATRAGNKVQLYKAETIQNQLDFICESIKQHQNQDQNQTVGILLRTAAMYEPLSSRLKFHGIKHSDYFGAKSSTNGSSDLLLECNQLQHILPQLIDFSVATDTEAFKLLMEDVQAAIMNSGCRATVADLIRKLDAVYSPTLPPADHQRRMILNQLLNVAKNYDAGTQLIQFIVDNKDTQLICEEEDEDIDVENTNSQSDAQAVYVGSVHSAKGLELDVVYVPNVQQHCYPIGTNGDYNEDCRVLFVAVSRAKSKLSHCNDIEVIWFYKTNRLSFLQIFFI